VDVIIPTKNSESTLEACLKSLRKQTIKINIIVVDANSTDRTRIIAKKYNCKILTEPRSTVKGSRRAVACNKGLKYSSSTFVAFIDSDTIVPETWAKDLTTALSTSNLQQDVAGVTSGCHYKRKIKDFSFACHLISQIGSTHAKDFDKIQEIKSIPGYNAIYRRKFLDLAGGFSEEIGGCEDRELNIRLLKAGYKLLGIPHSPVEHRQNHTPHSFAKQMYWYAWSRSRLLKIKKIFSPLHALPSLTLLFLIILGLLFPPVQITFFHSLLTLTYPPILEKIVEIYLFLIALWSFVLTSNTFTLKLWLQTISAFIIQHFSWSLGYLKGLLD